MARLFAMKLSQPAGSEFAGKRYGAAKRGLPLPELSRLIQAGTQRTPRFPPARSRFSIAFD